MRIASLVMLLLAAGCSWQRVTRHRAAPTPVVATPARALPAPLPISRDFERAVARGTRTRTGQPGPRYWQQFARYHIDAELVPSSSQINGRETVRYFNRSPDTLPTLWIYLDQNLFAPSSPRVVSVPVTSGTEILRVSAAGQALSRQEHGVGYSIDATLMRVGLPKALAPGDSIDLDIAWDFQLPPDGAPREGATGDLFMVAYWYPRLAVYDDVGGWERDPYLGQGEFYMDYADFDVNISLPQGWLVAATGELTNPNDVLSPQTRSRLAEARRSGSVVHVVRDQDRGAGAAKATTTGFDGVLTWRFRARNVRDFDWGASPKYLWDATLAVVGDRDADHRADTTTINTFYRPEARASAWDRSASYERSVIEFLSTYLWPYPWPQMTALEGPASCAGMEYPMLTCIGGPRDTLSLYSVQVHESAHMWFPMQVGSDERRYAWQDEGLTRFNQIEGMQAYFKGYDRVKQSRDGYLSLAATDSERPLMRAADLYPPDSRAYSIASYDKMALNMIALRAILGDTVFLSVYRTYGLRWLYKHPTPYDFFNTFDALSGQSLAWFWRPWWYDTWTLDQAIASTSVIGDQMSVVIDDRGLAPMPIRLAVTRSGGRIERVVVPATVWLSGSRRYTVTLEGAATITAVEIDPEQLFPDVDRSNNRWVRR
ncbi:MAG TPA: M1 family metallopeptidase [Gemmatimonadaceae bacterium]|nr:M1 family metallopeptidase [Gemmatimonadaceae bacterium]